MKLETVKKKCKLDGCDNHFDAQVKKHRMKEFCCSKHRYLHNRVIPDKEVQCLVCGSMFVPMSFGMKFPQCSPECKSLFAKNGRKEYIARRRTDPQYIEYQKNYQKSYDRNRVITATKLEKARIRVQNKESGMARLFFKFLGFANAELLPKELINEPFGEYDTFVTLVTDAFTSAGYRKCFDVTYRTRRFQFYGGKLLPEVFGLRLDRDGARLILYRSPLDHRRLGGPLHVREEDDFVIQRLRVPFELPSVSG